MHMKHAHAHAQASKPATASGGSLAATHGLDERDTLVFDLPVEYHCKLLDMVCHARAT